MSRALPGRSADLPLPEVTLIGKPFGSTGRAEHVRAVCRALRAAGIDARLLNAGDQGSDPQIHAEFTPFMTERLAPGIRVFSLNADEVPGAFEFLEASRPGALQAGYNIVFPAWELPRYPAGWARELERFDEVWTASPFADKSIGAAVTIPTHQLPNACEPHIGAPLERSHFGIPEERFAILFFFDFWSYTTRKNPWAAIAAFRQLVDARPSAPVQLVLKLNNSGHQPEVVERIKQEIAGLGDRVTVLDGTLPDNDVKNLVRCCDCFLSLHRSEGFGRGPAEAMFFGKPVVATGWSGNMEYMNEAVSFPVRYSLIPVEDGEYPHGNDQVWADADVGHAAEILVKLIDDPSCAAGIGARARAHMLENYSDIAIGRRYAARLRDIAATAAR